MEREFKPAVDSSDSLSQTKVVCYTPTMMLSNGISAGGPFAFTIPILIMQITLIIVTSRILVFILKPFRQPRVVSEILAGLILGPSVLGRSRTFSSKFFPLRSIGVLETMAHVGLIYFLFLVGVEMDLTLLRRTGQKALVIAVSGMFVPFMIGMVVSLLTGESDEKDITYLLFTGVSLSVTAFPVLARILAELKLLNTDLGRIAMSSAVINDLLSWILLSVGIALSEDDGDSFVSLWVILSGATYVCFCIYVVRPAITWMVKHTPDGEPLNDISLSFILAGMMLCSVITDAIGIHAIFGAFMFGLVISDGPLGASLIDKLEDFVSGLLLPLFFAISGLRSDVRMIDDVRKCITVMLVIVVSCAGKVVGTLMICRFYGMPLREGLSLGMLMNTKGLMEMIILNVGREQRVIDDDTFVILVITSVVMTGIITPVVTTIYRPARRFISYKRRTIQRVRADQELRVLACVHNPRTVPTIINLLEAAHPTKRSPIFIYGLLLVELTGRSSAMMIAHNSRKHGRAPVNRTQANCDQIASAFEHFQHHSVGVSAHTLTSISPYSSMHEDICDLAEDKRVAFILLPFHKQQTVDGGMEATNPALRSINTSVLANAPCSVGILIDRGLGGITRLPPSQVSHHVGVLFFGGPDDREALAYAWRMAEHPAINLTVVRFLEGDDTSSSIASGMTSTQKDCTRTLAVVTDDERERQLDDDYVNQFRLRHVSNETVFYKEKVVNNAEDTVEAIREMNTIHDLYIVGRGQGTSPLTSGLTDWSDCPELGGIGDLLASSDFASTTSVLVVQQFVGAMPSEGMATPDSPGQHMDQYLENTKRAKGTLTSAYLQRSPTGMGS